MKNKKWNILLVIFLIIMIICIGCIIYYFLKSQKSLAAFATLKIQTDIGESTEDDLLEYCVIDGQKVQKKFADLYKENHDFIGWISIEDTVIDYPVMQSDEDEQYYLHRNFDKEYDYAGCIFASTFSDIEKSSDNILLYGHHMNTGIMFAPLMNYENQKWTDEHRYIEFDTLYENATYKVIAAFRTQLYTSDYDGFVYYDFINADTESDFNDYISNITALSSITTDEKLNYGDKLLSLSTCAYHTANGRFVVVAKKIKEQHISDSSEDDD